MNTKSKKPLKDVDTAKRASILNTFMKVFPLLAILGLVLGGVLGILIAFAVSILAAIISEWLSGFIGGSAQLLYGIGRRSITLHDQLAGTMSIARNHKMYKRFDHALLSVEEVLAKDPNYSEALLLKAQILWEGFEDAVEAKMCLEKIMGIEKDKNNPIYRWTTTLHEQLTRIEGSLKEKNSPMKSMNRIQVNEFRIFLKNRIEKHHQRMSKTLSRDRVLIKTEKNEAEVILKMFLKILNEKIY